MNKYLTIPIFLLFIILFTTPVVSAKHTCGYCSKDINGIFVHVQDMYFHPSHFRCSICDNQIKGSEYYFEDNKFYDDSCYQKQNTLYCNYCQKEIASKYFIKEGQKLHEDCYQKLYSLTCEYCQQSITGKYITFENNKYHNHCYQNHIAFRCAICSLTINDDFFEDLWGYKYHAKHETDSYKCDYCGGYFSLTREKSGKIYSDKRGCCSVCLETALFSFDDNQKIFTTVNEKLEKYGV